MTEKPQIFEYRPDIDGLRAIAVLSVVIYHFFPTALTGGFVGVDVFFVISGFLITKIIFQNLDFGHFSFLDFYYRRIRRIFPSLIVVLFSVSIFGWFTLFPDEMKNLAKHIASSAVFIQNFTLLQEAGYFDISGESKPLLHLWSLSVEEQFYVLWPLSLWGCAKMPLPKRTLRDKNISSFVLIFSVFIISYFFSAQMVETDANKAFYLPQYRFFEMAVGGMVAWQQRYRPWREAHTKLNNFFSGIGIFGLALVFSEYDKETLYPGTLALVSTFATSLIICAGADSWINRHILSSKCLVWVGLLSYPLYLWHWPIVSFGNIIYAHMPTIEFKMIGLTSSIVLAWLTFKYVEKPIRSTNQSRGPRTLILCGSLIFLAIGGRFVEKDKTVIEWSKGSKHLSGLYYTNDNLPDEEKCDPQELIHESIDFCIRSKAKASRKIDALIIGDSHAVDKFHGLAKRDPSRNWLVLANPSCPPVLGLKIVGTDKVTCAPKVEAMIKYGQNNPSIELVLLAFYGSYFHLEALGPKHPINVMPKIYKDGVELTTFEERAHEFAKALEKTLIQLQSKKVVLLIDIPELHFRPFSCLRDTHLCYLPLKEVIKRQEKLRSIAADLKSKFKNVSVFDPLSFICSADRCSYKNGSTIFYRDNHHLSLQGSDAYAEHLLRFLK